MRLGWTVLMIVGVFLALVGSARAVERNFAGSAQLDWHFITQRAPHDADRQVPLDGFTTETAWKLAADVTTRLSGNAKVCYGCHGFELPMAYLDYRVADELSFRAGRFSPSFGAFNLRHDPANHKFADKPLPYDMGRMSRLRQWNLGVLPSPFPDNGLEVGGTHWFGTKAQLDWAVYAVNGFRGDRGGLDLDFQASRSVEAYYADNNGRPTLGARVSLTSRLGAASDVTWGLGGMHGTFDPSNRLHYTVVGADLSLRFDRTNLRVEWLARRQEFDASEPARFRYALPADGGDFFVKHGAYAELDHPLAKWLDLLVRVDGLYRKGNVVAASPLRRQSAVSRLSVGTSIVVERGLRLKVSGEYWDFSDPGPDGRHGELGLHVGIVGTY